MMLKDVEKYYHRVTKEIKDCKRCPLHTGATRKVPGHGKGQYIWLVGEAPGKNEDKTGYPFVGRAGQTLDAMLKEANLSRDQFFVTNICKCRPPSNRTPTEFEAYECIRMSISKEIAVLQPNIVITMGNSATEYYLRFVCGYKKPIPSITTARTLVYRNRPEVMRQVGQQRAVIPVFHPAYCMRNRIAYHTTIDDFKKINGYLLSNDTKQLMRKGRWLYD